MKNKEQKFNYDSSKQSSESKPTNSGETAEDTSKSTTTLSANGSEYGTARSLLEGRLINSLNSLDQASLCLTKLIKLEDLNQTEKTFVLARYISGLESLQKHTAQLLASAKRMAQERELKG